MAVVGPTDISALYELDRIAHRRRLDHGTGEVVDHGHSGSHWLPVGGATVGILVWEGSSGAKIRVQASVPNMLRGHNWDGAAPAELPGAVEMLLDSVANELPDVPRADQVRLSRVDLTRDFVNVREPAATLRAIAGHPMARATVDQHYPRPDGHGLQTLMRGNKTHWVARGYDKTYEALSGSGLHRKLASVRPRQLRFEVELRSKELRYRGIDTVDDLLDADLASLTRYYFERCKFDVNSAQTGMADLVEMLTIDGVTAAQQRNLIVYLTCLQYGVQPPFSRGPFEEARALANRYKLAPDSLGKSTFTRRLDFALGLEVVD